MSNLFNNGFARLLGISGSIAVTIISIALWRKRKIIYSDPVRQQLREREAEKLALKGEKELVEKKLYELENFLDQLTRDIEGLKSTIKDKQAVIDTHELEKERMYEHERMLRKESNEHIERLHRRAQKFLIDFEEKASLAAVQQQQIASMEAFHSQFQAEQERLAADLHRSSEELRRARGECATLGAQRDRLSEQRDRLAADLKNLLANYVFANHRATTVSHEQDTSVVEVHDSKLAALIKSWSQQGILDDSVNFPRYRFACAENGANGKHTNSNGNTNNATNGHVHISAMSSDEEAPMKMRLSALVGATSPTSDIHAASAVGVV